MQMAVSLGSFLFLAATVAAAAEPVVDIYDAGRLPITLELTSPAEVCEAARKAVGRVRDALVTLADLSEAVPPGSWNISVSIAETAPGYNVTVATKRQIQGRTEHWAEATYSVPCRDFLPEWIETATRAAVPLGGTVVRQNGTEALVRVPACSTWLWATDARLSPGRGVVITHHTAPARFAVVTRVSEEGLWIGALDDAPVREASRVIVPAAGSTYCVLHVVGEGLQPLAGAIVRSRLAAGESPPVLRGATDVGGNLTVVLPAGTPVELELEYPGVRVRLRRVPYLAREILRVRLPVTSARSLVMARANDLYDQLRRFQEHRNALAKQIHRSIEKGDPDAVEQLVNRLENLRPPLDEWAGEFVLVKEEAERRGELIDGIAQELQEAITRAATRPDVRRYREWVEARRKQLRVQELTRRARTLTERMQWEELLACYRELETLTGDSLARQRANYLEQALKPANEEHKVARQWVTGWLAGASLEDIEDNLDLVQLNVEQLLANQDSLYLLVVQRQLARWAEEIGRERRTLERQADQARTDDQRQGILQRLQKLSELASRLAELLDRIAPLVEKVPL